MLFRIIQKFVLDRDMNLNYGGEFQTCRHHIVYSYLTSYLPIMSTYQCQPHSVLIIYYKSGLRPRLSYEVSVDELWIILSPGV